MFERYEHSDWAKPVPVWVRSDQQGKHREHCLCHAPCGKFHPNTPENCPLAQELFEFDVRHGMTTPVYECPEFQAPA